jgi:hypothetical protein
MPQVVESDVRQVGCFQQWLEHPAREIAFAERTAIVVTEDVALLAKQRRPSMNLTVRFVPRENCSW